MDKSGTHRLLRLLAEYENRPIVRNSLPDTQHERTANRDEFLYKALGATAYCTYDDPPEELEEQYTRIRDIVLATRRRTDISTRGPLTRKSSRSVLRAI